MLLGGMAVGVGSVVVGLAAARFWGLAPGGTIVLVAAFAFGGVSVGSNLRRRRAGVAAAGDPIGLREDVPREGSHG
jgi:ABC-type Mn2+/Zn2+ transport system permease subunit